MIRRALVLVAVVVGVLFAAPAAHAQYQPGQPGLAVIPSETTPGQPVQVQGFGCPRNSTVTISIGGTTLATTTAGDNAQGSFEATITAPNTPGFYTVTASCGDILVSAGLQVNPVATTGPTTLPTTGSGLTMTLIRVGVALVAVGGCVVLAMRKRRTRV